MKPWYPPYLLEMNYQHFRCRQIIHAVAECFNLGSKDLMNYDRHPHIVEARHAAMYLARRATGCSWSELGRVFGRDHTTVLLAVRKIANKAVFLGGNL